MGAAVDVEGSVRSKAMKEPEGAVSDRMSRRLKACVKWSYERCFDSE